ncbi:hypothetical protein VHEMI04526 [[Torrubiella] hemipterigena]|uniref:Alpha/beta hydrolase fold-3 domain-containing protein n=1 Tax=[Torrubiella] hemipterigena TaxID=1531966 RepID=A0A0A1SVJ0_9HYPO|nr:hypothetical protein VHEMI04526 [[Torrubiella] hemipterigena]
MGLPLDEEFAAASAPFLQAITNVPKPATHDVEARRQLLASFATGSAPEIPPEIEHEILSVVAADGYKIPVWRFKKKTASTNPGPAVLHIHGGGFISLSPAMNVPQLCHATVETGVQIFSVDYRLAPEHPYPTPLEDCWDILKWITANDEQLGVDVHRIGIMGESAGGGLAAGVTLLARDRGLSPPLARQILGYPMLDDRTRADSDMPAVTLWSESDNVTGWTAYLGDRMGGDGVPPYAAPGRATDFSGLPPLYMDVGQLDMFVREDIDYMRRAVQAGIEVEFHLYSGLPHGFDGIAPEHSMTKAFYSNRIKQLRIL